MSAPGSDPLALGQKLISVLDDGLRTATYKLATLIALLDFAVENLPRNVDVDLDELAERVIAIYWRPVRDLDGHYLKQSSNRVARIPDAVRNLKSLATTRTGSDPTLEFVRRFHSDPYRAAVATVRQTLVTQPLYRLQRVRGARTHECFLYDDTWLSEAVSAKQLAAHGNKITLFPGVCTTLARLSSLLRTALQISWLDDVRRHNPFLQRNVPDLATHHFGADRISLERARNALADNFGSRCFYCDAATTHHVDHVLPWSRVGLDGLTNLVLACAACNLNKSQLLPTRTSSCVHSTADRKPSLRSRTRSPGPASTVASNLPPAACIPRNRRELLCGSPGRPSTSFAQISSGRPEPADRPHVSSLPSASGLTRFTIRFTAIPPTMTVPRTATPR